MRSVFRDLTDDFFEILTYRKEEWDLYWEKYKNSQKFIYKIAQKEGLNDEDVVNNLKHIGRRELDKAYWYKQEILNDLKSQIISELTKNSKKWQVERGDYALYLSCFLGNKPYEYIESFKGTIIFVDFLYIYFNKDKLIPKDLIEEAIMNFITTVPVNTKKSNFWVLYDKVKTFLSNSTYEEKNEIMQKIVKLLFERIPYYNWVGFYLVDKEDGNVLVLGPYIGESTEHTKIRFGQGICGQAASLKTTFVVDDVTKVENYLSCSPKTKSEIVVPIFDKESNIVGEIDIDSHEKSPFDNDDKKFLEEIAKLITEKFY